MLNAHKIMMDTFTTYTENVKNVFLLEIINFKTVVFECWHCLLYNVKIEE